MSVTFKDVRGNIGEIDNETFCALLDAFNREAAKRHAKGMNSRVTFTNEYAVTHGAELEVLPLENRASLELLCLPRMDRPVPEIEAALRNQIANGSTHSIVSIPDDASAVPIVSQSYVDYVEELLQERIKAEKIEAKHKMELIRNKLIIFWNTLLKDNSNLMGCSDSFCCYGDSPGTHTKKSENGCKCSLKYPHNVQVRKVVEQRDMAIEILRQIDGDIISRPQLSDEMDISRPAVSAEQ